MGGAAQDSNVCIPQFLEISDDDIITAMKKIHGYLDITPGDFKLLYRSAYQQAIERLTQLVKARDVMTKGVIYVEGKTPSGEVADLMAINGISGVPVVENGGKVVGVISEKDFLFHMGGEDAGSFMNVVAQCLRNKGCVALSMRQQKAQDIMSAPAATVFEDTPVSEIANIFSSKSINRVPVVDSRGSLVGIVARADILQYAFPALPDK